MHIPDERSEAIVILANISRQLQKLIEIAGASPQDDEWSYSPEANAEHRREEFIEKLVGKD